ncbi:MAG: hypothetical protein WAM91_09235 [Candidatus Acidiferrales bacterium]
MNTIRRRSRLALALAIAVGFGLAGAAAPQTPKDPANAALAFDKLKTLTGRWEAMSEKGKASAAYQVVSNGTAILEHVIIPGEAEMITVYYLDGNRLLLTHFCEAGNQPRLQAGGFDPKTNSIDFQFLDATNLASPDTGHMHHVVIKFRGPSEMVEEWTWYQGGKPGFTVPLVYHRID